MVLLSQDMTAGEKKRILSDKYGIRMSEKDSREVDEMCNYGQGIAEKNFKRGIEQTRQIYRYLKKNNRLDEYDRGMEDPDYLDMLMKQFREAEHAQQD